jgi:hypothetical protein
VTKFQFLVKMVYQVVNLPQEDYRDIKESVLLYFRSSNDTVSMRIFSIKFIENYASCSRMNVVVNSLIASSSSTMMTIPM